MITRVRLKNFTAFRALTVNCAPGINVFVGENGTGKTHVLKVIHAACDITKGENGSRRSFAEKLTNVFLPSKRQIGRLIRRQKVSTKGYVDVHREVDGEARNIRLSWSNHTTVTDNAKVSGTPTKWRESKLRSVFIPVKEMLANAPGFRSLYAGRDIWFEEVYSDIIDCALLSLLRGPVPKERKRILNIFEDAMKGKVETSGEDFFLRSKQGKLEFTLLAEGFRKLGLLWVLIQNGALLKGSVLCWDEPEANLNPKLMRSVVAILLELQRMGVQIFLSTHSYVLLKEFDLQGEEQDCIRFHSLYHDAEAGDEITIHSTDPIRSVTCWTGISNVQRRGCHDDEEQWFACTSGERIGIRFHQFA